jgi:hypothetical protein
MESHLCKLTKLLLPPSTNNYTRGFSKTNYEVEWKCIGKMHLSSLIFSPPTALACPPLWWSGPYSRFCTRWSYTHFRPWRRPRRGHGDREQHGSGIRGGIKKDDLAIESKWRITSADIFNLLPLAGVAGRTSHWRRYSVKLESLLFVAKREMVAMFRGACNSSVLQLWVVSQLRPLAAMIYRLRTAEGEEEEQCSYYAPAFAKWTVCTLVV